MHGGTIQAQSQGTGQGSTFTVKLPVLKASKRAEQRRITYTSVSSPQSPSPNLLTGLRVLVVDDEADVRQWITTVLEECGAEITAVSSTGEVLEALEELQPDVLISDIGMPNEDGYALMRKIRELEPELGGRIPAVALTGYARVEDYKQALAAGFQLHVAKPVRAAELIAVVASLGKMSGKV